MRATAATRFCGGVAVASALAAFACGDDGPPPAPPPPPPQQYEAAGELAAREEVALELDAQRDGEIVIVAGTADLPNGALISFEIRHERFGTLPGSAGFEDGHTTVRGGRFSERVGVAGWPPGAIEVWAAFEPRSVHGEQPAAVLERYGGSGERLAGENVGRRGAVRWVEARQTIR